MKSVIIRGLMLAFVAAAGALTFGSTALATHVDAAITAPVEATVGETADITASLEFADNGKPIANTPVTFYMTGEFGGVESEFEIGRAVTGEDGIATLSYEPRTAGDHQVRIEYAIGGETETESAITTVSVTGSSEQLQQSSAGVDIPGLNVWLLIALVTGVWAILLTVALRVIAIAHAGNSTASP